MRPQVISIVPEADPFNGPEKGQNPVDFRDIRSLREDLERIQAVQVHHGSMLVKISSDLDWLKTTLAELMTRLQGYR